MQPLPCQAFLCLGSFLRVPFAENKRSYRTRDNIQDKRELCHFSSRKPFVALQEFAQGGWQQKAAAWAHQDSHHRHPLVALLSQGEDRDGSCSGTGWEPPQLLLI